ncbi:hypothetical protein PG991_013626 [Apiospora marii]|uniref:Uncharacterized protein n=1 Tax=Apiospora marii TaxID=335849 RepID=A0ABR1R6I8_9PEZI
MKECRAEDALDRLWAAVVSRRPWRGAPDLRLGRDAGFDMELVCAKAEEYGFPCFKRLPSELVRIVYTHSSLATFWRYIAIVSLARKLGAAPTRSGSLPLRDVSAWSRGWERPALLPSPPPERLSSIRLTVDWHGVKQIERLSGMPPCRRWVSENARFIILTEGVVDQLENIMVQYKYGILRLVMPDSFGGSHIWDMPDPPPLADCRFSGAVIPQATQFRAIDLRRATGLTFHFNHNKVYEIFAHTRAAPYARRATSQQHHGVPHVTYRRAWVHLPIPKGEEILAIAVRMTHGSHHELSTQKPCFLFRMKLTGDVALGPNYSGDYEDVNLSQASPELLIYNTLSAGPATLFGAYPRRVRGQENDTERNDDDNSRDNDGNSNSQALFFSAPLDNVTRLQVLGDPGSGHCHAVLLDYANGSRRALGNCRLGVDPVIGTYLEPARICCRPVTPVTPTAAETAAARGPSIFTIARSFTGTEHLFVTGRTMMQVDSGPEPANSAHRHRDCCGGGGGDDEDFYEDAMGHHYHDSNNYGWKCSSLQGNTMKMWFSAEKSIIHITPAATSPTG